MLRKILFPILLFLVCALFSVASEPVAVLSVNVRYGSAKDGENSWPHRRDALAELIRATESDFIGGQEVLIHPTDEVNQFKFLSEKLPEYGSLCRGREKDEKRGESTPLFYRKDRWEADLDEQGVFWLSDTPEVPGSITWKGQSECPRNVTWALFHEKDKDGKRTGLALYVFNTHFDHVGEIARQKAADLIMRRIAARKHAAIPAVFMGDLNAGENSKAIRYLLGGTVDFDGEEKTPPFAFRDSFRVLHPEETFVATFNAFKEPPTKGGKIDYILLTPGPEVVEAEILRTKTAEGRYPSDHFPIRALLKIPGKEASASE